MRVIHALVQALFAIALFRQGNSDAALEVVEEVAQDVKGKGKALQDANLLLLCSYVFEQFGKGARLIKQMTMKAVNVLIINLDIDDRANRPRDVGGCPCSALGGLASRAGEYLLLRSHRCHTDAQGGERTFLMRVIWM